MLKQRHVAPYINRSQRLLTSIIPLILILVMLIAGSTSAIVRPVSAESERDHDSHVKHAVSHDHHQAQIAPAATTRTFIPLVDRPAGSTPQPSTSPRASTAPQPSASPRASTAPQPSGSPRASAAPQPTTTPRPVPTQMPGMMEPVTPAWVGGCPTGTVPFESQGWWMNDFGHVHVGFCAPHNGTIRGTYEADTYMVLYRNPGQLKILQAQIDGSSTVTTVSVKQTCSPTATCVFNQKISIDTASFPNSGWHHLRIRATVLEPDGKELVATNFIPVFIDNGKPRKDFRQVESDGTLDYVAGRGWYTDAEYIWSIVFDPPKVGETVSGVHTFRVRPMATSTPRPISYFVVKLDATHTSPGVLLFEQRSDSTDIVSVQLDTRTLADGWHSIIVRSESAGQPGATCAFCSGQPQVHAGDTKIWFFVDN